jgi:hypothetical protein
MVFYQMLTGELPGRRIEPPSRKVHIDVRLNEVVLRALEKEPERRYQHVSEVKTAVETIVQTAAPAAIWGRKFSKRFLMGMAIGVAVTVGCWIFYRPSNPSPPPLATVEQVLEHYAKAKGPMAGADKTRTLSIKGVFTSRDALGTLEVEAFVKAPDKWLLALKDTNGFVFRRAFDGSVAWEISAWGRPNVDPGTLWITQTGIGVYRGDSLTTLFPKMTLKGKVPMGSGQTYVLEAELPGRPLQLWFDTQNGLLVRMESKVAGFVEQMDWEDYRDVGGLMVPFRLRQAGSENWTIQCSEVKCNETIDDALFAQPPNR